MKTILSLVILLTTTAAFADYDCTNKKYDQVLADHAAVQKTIALFESELPANQEMQTVGALYKKQIEITKCQLDLLWENKL